MVDLRGIQLTTPLKSWEDLGGQSFAGYDNLETQVNASSSGGWIAGDVVDRLSGLLGPVRLVTR